MHCLICGKDFSGKTEDITIISHRKIKYAVCNKCYGTCVSCGKKFEPGRAGITRLVCPECRKALNRKNREEKFNTHFLDMPGKRADWVSDDTFNEINRRNFKSRIADLLGCEDHNEESFSL
ncbi:MAG: hypothetical protein U5L76_01110 [Patescibacteria group bacterium]|nr:hypothetical protein [Patescibacteria group bacterium]